jgi:hypothetical protein
MQIDKDTLRAALEGAVRPLEWYREREEYFAAKGANRTYLAYPLPADPEFWGAAGVTTTGTLADVQSACQEDTTARIIAAIDIDTLAAKLGGV